jgi:hypothetical protein
MKKKLSLTKTTVKDLKVKTTVKAGALTQDGCVKTVGCSATLSPSHE